MTGSKPLVSVGVPTYNEEKCIAECLGDLQGQSYADIEIIVSDDASTDRTVAICREHAAQDERIRVLASEQRLGFFENSGRALAAAKGDLYLPRDADDISSGANYIECLVDLLLANPSANVATSAFRSFLEDGREVLDIVPEFPADRLERALAIVNCSELHKVLFRKKYLMDISDRLAELFPDYWGGDHLKKLFCALDDAVVGTNEVEYHNRFYIRPTSIPRPDKRGGNRYASLGARVKGAANLLQKNRQFYRAMDQIIKEADVPDDFRKEFRNRLRTGDARSILTCYIRSFFNIDNTVDVTRGVVPRGFRLWRKMGKVMLLGHH